MSDASLVSEFPAPGHPGSRVSVGPPGAAVNVREPDLEWRPPEAMAQDILLIDRQHLVEERAFYSRVVERLNTLQAVQGSSQWSLDFDPGTDEVTVHWLRVHRNGAVLDHTDPSKFRCIQREENLERLVVDGKACLLVLLEDIRPGDVLDTAVTIRTEARVMRDHFSHLGCVSFPVHVGRLWLRFRFREDRPVVWKSNIAALVPEDSTVDGVRELEWTRTAVKPLAAEQNVPPWHLFGGWIQVSDFGSWQEVSSGFHEAWSIHQPAGELDDILTEIQNASDSRLERVEQAIRFVQDEIRYLSVDTELGGQTPSAPAAVLRRRFGDCKDKALLLTRLLEALGLRTRPVLVHTRIRRELRNWLPCPVFNHVIVSYELDGVWYFVDATISLQGGGAARRFVPRYEAGLPVTNEGVLGLQTVETPPGSDGRVRLEERFEIDPSGGASDLFVTLRATGSHADDLRATILHQGVDTVARGREQFYRSLQPGCVRMGALEWQDDREANALTLSERYELPDRSGLLPAPHHYTYDQPAHQILSFLSGTNELNRRRPWHLAYPAHVEHVVECGSPSISGYTSESDSVEAPEFTFSWKVRPGPGAVRVSMSLRILADEVKADGFARYIEAVKKVYRWKDVFLHVPRTRQILRRRGDRPLLGDHAATVALVTADRTRGKPVHLSMTGSFPNSAGNSSDSGGGGGGGRSNSGGGGGLDAAASAVAAAVKVSMGQTPSTPLADLSVAPAAGESRAAPPLNLVPEELLTPPPDPADAEETEPEIRQGRGKRKGRSLGGDQGQKSWKRPKKRLSGNAKLSLLGCGIFIFAIPAISLVWTLISNLTGNHQATTEDYEQANGQATRDPQFNEAQRLYYQGDLAGARKLYDEVKDKYPLSSRVQTIGIHLLVTDGQYAEAGKQLVQWRGIYPADPELRDIRVNLLLAQKDHGEAVRVAEENAAQPYAGSSALLQLGRAYDAAGNQDKAAAALRQYISLEPGDHHARYLLGSICAKQGKTSELTNLWQEALTKFPQDETAAALAGQQLAEAGLTTEAGRVLEAASVRLPGSAKVAFQTGVFLKAAGFDAKALECFRRAATLNQSWLEPALNLAILLEAANRPEAARVFELAADRCPNDPARLLAAAKTTAPVSARGAQVFLQRALRLSPENPEAWELLAVTWENLAQPEKAAAARRHDSSLLPVRQ